MFDNEFERLMEPKTINAYSCGKDGHIMITRNVDQGTTPMTITCRHCVAEGRYGIVAYSSCYNVDQDLEPTYEWYKPKYVWLIRDLPTRQHCKNGGLLLREVGQVDYTEQHFEALSLEERIQSLAFELKEAENNITEKPNLFDRLYLWYMTLTIRFRSLTNVNKSHQN